MVREKKVGIKYYLNKRLKSTLIEDVDLFPVYVSVTYNRSNTQFPFFLLNASGGITEKTFEESIVNRKNKELDLLLKSYENNIKNAVRYESKILGEEFTLKGLSKRVYLYENNLLSTIEKYILNQFRIFVSQYLDRKSMKKIFNDFHFFVDSYYMVKNDYIEDLKNVLPYALQINITAYIQYIAFGSSKEGKEDIENPIKIKDWLSEQIKDSFRTYLMKSNEYHIFPKESEKSPIIKLYKDFPINRIDIKKYLLAIDLIIKELIKR